MKHDDSAQLTRSLTISISTSIVLLAAGIFIIDSVTTGKALEQVTVQLIRLIFFISLGIFLGLVIEDKGWTRYLAIFSAPVFRFARLGQRCSAAFGTAIFSGVAANAMLNTLYHERKISRQQLFLSNFINQFPAFFLHLPTTFFIVVSLTRWAGVLYFSLTFAALILRSTGCIIYGHLALPPIKTEVKNPIGANPNEPIKHPSSIWNKLKNRLPRRIAKVIVYVVPTYIAVYLVNAAGGFNMLRTVFANWVVDAFLPVESLSVIILSFVAEFTSGFAAAGALLNAGVLTMKQTVIALLIGNIVAFPVRALRHQLPRYLGIFTPKLGIQILLSGQLLRITSLIIIGWLYFLFF
jgi:hypothetical protein